MWADLMFKNNYKINLSKEDKLMIICARTQIMDKDNRLIIDLLGSDLDWNNLIKKSGRHRLLPLLYWNLKNFEEYVPSQIFTRLKIYFYLNAQKNLMFLGEIKALTKLIKTTKNNVLFIPYKGPIMAISTYNDIKLRDFNDIDIFINTEDFSQIKAILLSRGYNTNLTIDKLEGNWYVKTQRECKFYNIEKGISIELHWKFSRLCSPTQMEEIIKISQLKSINIEEITIPEFLIEDLILILCVHNATHYWNRLLWLVDIVEIINHNNNIDWNLIIAKAMKLKLNRILLINLRLLNDLFSINFPKSVTDHLYSDKNMHTILNIVKTNYFKENYSFTLLKEGFLSIKMRDTILYGMKDFLKNCFVPDQSEFNVLNYNVSMFVLYLFIRPFKLLIKYKIL